MQTQELERRANRAEMESFVIAKTAEGFRVCSPLNPANQYVVSGIPDAPRCTCPDFTNNEGDPEWLCKHILAVLNQTQPTPALPLRLESERVETPPGNGRPRRQRNSTLTESGAGTMVIKRSVSPDGRIDSLSVEFACPVGNTPPEAVRSCAEATLGLQAEIVQGFLAKHVKPSTVSPSREPIPEGASPARLLKVDAMDTRWGRRLFIAVQVNGETLKLFGSLGQLGAAIKAAGFANVADRIAEGMSLDLPCLAITKPSQNGRYLNVERVLPARNGG